MEIWHFFVIFHDFVMKCVYKSTIYTFVIRDKIWTPPFVVQKCTCYFCVLGPENSPLPHTCPALLCRTYYSILLITQPILSNFGNKKIDYIFVRTLVATGRAPKAWY